MALGISELYERYGPELRFFLERQLRLRHRVEDVLHDVFECLLKYPPTQELQKADHYLWRIAWRLVNAANRRVDVDRERITMVIHQADDWVFGQSSTPTPADVAQWLAYQEHVRRCLDCLTPDERTAVIMARLGFSFHEIASQMQMDPDAVRKHLRQGCLFLKTAASTDNEE